MAHRGACAERRLARLRGNADGRGRDMSVESQITEWRAYVSNAAAVNGRDVAELNSAGLADDEAFLVAVKRMGSLDAISREFAREHSGRLWKQLMLTGEDEPTRMAGGFVEPLLFAVA